MIDAKKPPRTRRPGAGIRRDVADDHSHLQMLAFGILEHYAPAGAPPSLEVSPKVHCEVGLIQPNERGSPVAMEIVDELSSRRRAH